MKSFSSVLLYICVACWSASSAADECAFKWDIHQEHALFVGASKPAAAATTAKTAPTIDLSTLYAVKLSSAEDVIYETAPGKKMLTEGTYGGSLAFTVPSSAAYRVALDGPFWIDVVADHKLVATKDFGGPQDCPGGPRKLVEFELKGGTSYLLQISGAAVDHVKVAITPSVPTH
jgi:hypothetical protein